MIYFNEHARAIIFFEASLSQKLVIDYILEKEALYTYSHSNL